jgi:multiple sugar transport system ATP-binding protein
LQQAGSPDEVYRRPANRFVASFFGPQGMNFIESPQSVLKIETSGAICGFRPEDAAIAQDNNNICGSVEACEQLGDADYIQVRIAEQPRPITIKLPHHTTAPQINEHVPITIDTTRLHWFERQTGKRINELNPGPRTLNPSRSTDHEPR